MISDNNHVSLPFGDAEPWVDEEERLGDRVTSPFVAAPADTARRIAALARLTAADRFIDIGCGDGAVCCAVRRLVGCECFGLDINPLLVDAAEQAYATEEAEVRELADDIRTKTSSATAAKLQHFFVGDFNDPATWALLAERVRPTVVYVYILSRFVRPIAPKLVELLSCCETMHSSTTPHPPLAAVVQEEEEEDAATKGIDDGAVASPSWSTLATTLDSNRRVVDSGRRSHGHVVSLRFPIGADPDAAIVVATGAAPSSSQPPQVSPMYAAVFPAAAAWSPPAAVDRDGQYRMFLYSFPR